MGFYFLVRTKKCSGINAASPQASMKTKEFAQIGGINATIERRRNRRNAAVIRQQELLDQAKSHVRSLFVPKLEKLPPTSA
eukprot:2221158-Rhodomonas_salina.2